MTRAALAETLRDSDRESSHEQYRVVVDTLTDEYDLMEVALAAVKLAHEAGQGDPDEDSIDIPQVRPSADGDRDNGPGHGAKAPVPVRRRGPSPARRRRSSSASATRPRSARRTSSEPIANETSLSGRQIGAIEITHKFSTVEIPSSAVDEVVAALQATMIKGRKARVERYKPPSERAPRGYSPNKGRDQ